MAALGVQEEAKRLASYVRERDGVELQLRVGLNSGQVIAGEIGSGPFGYTTIGEQVGMAQRMESAAPPGGVMFSESTARLVHHAATLGEPELVQIKGADEPVSGHRLLGIGEEHRAVGSVESNLVGRRWEMSAVEGLLERAIDGHGAVVGVVGPPGIGKSRLVREVSAMAASRGVEVFTAYCESHTTDIPFHVVARLLRVATAVSDLVGQEARDRVRDRIPEVGNSRRITAGCPASVLQLHPHVTVVVDEAAATQLANAEFYRYALKSRPGQQKQEADTGRRGEAHRRAQRTLRIFAVGKYQNSRSPLLMATRRPRHSLGVSGKN